MTDQDPIVARALRDVPVPDHEPGFWDRVDARLAEVEPGQGEPDGPATGPASGDPLDTGELPTVVALPSGAGRRPVPTRVLAAAAVVAVLALAVGLVSRFGGETRNVQSTDQATTTLSEPAGPSTSDPSEPPPPADGVGASTPTAAVEGWLDSVGRGDVDAAVALTGPRTTAYWEAQTGEGVDGYVRQSAEGFGAWAASPDRSTTLFDLGSVEGARIAVVVVSGTRSSEGTTEFRTDAIPAVQGSDGSWLAEPAAFEPATGGRIELISPTPAPGGGLNGLPPDGTVGAAAPGDGTFFFVVDEGPAEAVAGPTGVGAVRLSAVWDPPGELASGSHLLVIAYVDGATVTAFAGLFAVEG
ncbi:hypothetical protein BH20ACT2_BH20ACT2_15280 [soil metagenome]